MDSPKQEAHGEGVPTAKVRRKRILIAYNHSELSVLAEAHEPSEAAVGVLIALVASQGFDVFVVNGEDDCDRLGDAVVLYRPDLIVNLIDHFHGDTLMAGPAASLLDVYEYPYTGGDAHCITACQDRLQSRLALSSAGIAVPPFAPIWTRDDAVSPEGIDGVGFPMILTQSFDDIYHRPLERPLLEDRGAFDSFLAEIALDYDPPFLVEKYIDYQKMSVIVIGAKLALPPCEVWRDEDDEWQVTPAELTPDQAEAISAIAVRASAVMAARDWAQVEIAIDEAGDIFVTDVRPHVAPWSPESPFRVAAAEHEDGASGILAKVIGSALARAERLAAVSAEIMAELEDEDEPAADDATELPSPTQNGPTEVDPSASI